MISPHYFLVLILLFVCLLLCLSVCLGPLLASDIPCINSFLFFLALVLCFFSLIIEFGILYFVFECFVCFLSQFFPFFLKFQFLYLQHSSCLPNFCVLLCMMSQILSGFCSCSYSWFFVFKASNVFCFVGFWGERVLSCWGGVFFFI